MYEFSSFKMIFEIQPQTTPSLASQKKKQTIARLCQHAAEKNTVKAIKERTTWQEMAGETSQPQDEYPVLNWCITGKEQRTYLYSSQQ